MANVNNGFLIEYKEKEMATYLAIPQRFGTWALSDAKGIVNVHRKRSFRIFSCGLNKVKGEQGGIQWILCEGWSVIVAQNELFEGDLMVFTYHGNSLFTLDLYGANFAYKQICKTGEPPLWLMKIRGYPSDDVLGWSNNVIAVEMFLRESKFMNFYIRLSRKYKVEQYLNIPLGFCKNCLLYKTTNLTPATLMVRGHYWDVLIKFYKRADGDLYACKISKGSKEFATSHFLRDKTAIGFEMINVSSPLVFKVTIFS